MSAIKLTYIVRQESVIPGKHESIKFGSRHDPLNPTNSCIR